jgi:AcrR family transcriptional regulator
MRMARRDARARVLDVALEHFADLGVERTSIAMLGQDAEVGNGTIYHHFGDKRGIARELARREWTGWYRAMLGASRRGSEALTARQVGWALVRPASALGTGYELLRRRLARGALNPRS